MHTIFEANYDGVLDVAFHPVQPWVALALDNGLIPLLDCRSGTEISNFGNKDVDGPIYARDFHSERPIFASGSHNSHIQIWDINCGGGPHGGGTKVTTLKGHSGPVLTLQFHPNVQEFEWLYQETYGCCDQCFLSSQGRCVDHECKSYVWDCEKLKQQEEKGIGRSFRKKSSVMLL